MKQNDLLIFPENAKLLLSYSSQSSFFAGKSESEEEDKIIERERERNTFVDANYLF